MEAGKQILIELGKRGLRGYFFDSAQYQELKKVKDFSEAKGKISEYGYPAVKEAKDPKEVISLLKSAENKKDRNGCLIWALCEIIFWFVISLLTCAA